MNDACGSESRRLRASPSIKLYWLVASSAITTMFRRSERSGAWKARPLLHIRYGPPFSSGMNFWMVVNGGRRAPTDIDCAKRWAKPDQAGPRGSQNHAAARDVEQFPQMLDRIRLHRSLPQDFVATLELAEELIV